VGFTMKLMIGTGALMGLIVSAAQALPAGDSNFVTVQELYEECRATGVGSADAAIAAARNALCGGYIAGVGDTLVHTGGCPALIGASYGAMVQAFKNWAPAHPQDWSKQQVEGVIAALSTVWSCGKSL